MLIFLAFLIFLWILGVAYLTSNFIIKKKKKEAFVPFVPSDVQGIRDLLLHINIASGESLVDIGSGWGTVLFELSKRDNSLSLTGIELNPVLHLFAQFKKIFFYKNMNIKFIHGDAINFNYSRYNKVFLFMLPTFVQKIIIPKLEKEMKSGTQIISYGFPIKSEKFNIEEFSVNSSMHWVKNFYIATKK